MDHDPRGNDNTLIYLLIGAVALILIMTGRAGSSPVDGSYNGSYNTNYHYETHTTNVQTCIGLCFGQ